MISLRNRLVITYTLFVLIGALALSLLTNMIVGNLFTGFVKGNIAAQSVKIAEAIAEQFDPAAEDFDRTITTALGMNYVRQGYIITIEDVNGGIVWDARACDMGQCADVISDIEARMNEEFRLDGGFEKNTLPVTYDGDTVGYVHIESYGPYFYSESESGFLHSLNQFLAVVGITFAVMSVIISAMFAASLSKPIVKASNLAKKMADGHLSVRISDNQKTKELHELSHSINDLAAALENGERWQKRMINDVAHELRTPLTTLQGNMEAMIDGVWEPTAERLASCHEEIVRLNKLVEDLGLLSILEQENLVLYRSDFDLKRLLTAVADQFSQMAAEKGIVLRLACEGMLVYGDHDRLRQVMVNLVSNAVKYTDSGMVEIAAIDADNCVVIKISDTGIGIPSHDLPHVFERFYRSDKSRNRATGGAGIGLTVAATIVEAHGGRIDVASENGSGSIFSVILPKGVGASRR